MSAPTSKESGSAVAKLRADLERSWAPVLTQTQGQELLDLLAEERDYAEIEKSRADAAEAENERLRGVIDEVIDFPMRDHESVAGLAAEIKAVARRGLFEGV